MLRTARLSARPDGHGKHRNRRRPPITRNIGGCEIDTLDRGVAILHNHSDDFRLTGTAAADRYGAG